MKIRQPLISAVFLALTVGYPLAVGAQGGDAVFERVGVTSTDSDALRTIGGIKVGADAEVVGALTVGANADVGGALTVGTPILPQYLGSGTPTARTWLRGDGTWTGTGFQDAATDLLTADMSTMSGTYQTIMSGSVTVAEAGDAVLVHVTGQIGRLGRALLVVAPSQLFRIDNPTVPVAVLEGDFPSGITDAGGITSHGGSLYVVDDTGNELWRLDDPTAPAAAVLEGDFPSGLATIAPTGITSHGGSLYVVDARNDELWRLDNPADPGSAVLQGDFPSGITVPAGITSQGGVLYVVDTAGAELWRIDDPTNPAAAVLQGTFPSGLTAPTGITSHGGVLYVVDDTGNELWRVDDPTDPGAAVREGSFGISSPRGIVGIGDAPCMIRVARGTTEIEGFELDEGKILFDATFVDAPPVGTHTYSLQMRTQAPNTLCTVYRGEGTVPLPSLLVQSYYGGSIP